MPSIETTDYAWLHAALVFGHSMSKDPNRKVGACIVAPNKRAVSFGYNGLVAGVEESKENWSRPRKYGLVRHAELNAILNAPFDTAGSTLYSVLKPCHDCLGDAINAGINRVVWLHDPVPFVMQDEDAWNKFAEIFSELIEYPRTSTTLQIISALKQVDDVQINISTHDSKERSTEIYHICRMFHCSYEKATEIYDQKMLKEANEK